MRQLSSSLPKSERSVTYRENIKIKFQKLKTFNAISTVVLVTQQDKSWGVGETGDENRTWAVANTRRSAPPSPEIGGGGIFKFCRRPQSLEK